MKKLLFVILIILISGFIQSFELKKVLEFGSDHDENYLIFQPGPMVADQQGNIYQVDRETLVIRKYDQAGRFLARNGRKGQGPQEFMSIGCLVIQQDKLIAYDFSMKRITWLDHDLNFLGSDSLPQATGNQVAANNDFIIYESMNNYIKEITMRYKNGNATKVAYSASNFGKYEKYRKSPLFFVIFRYLLAVNQDSGEWLATLAKPLSGKMELIFFDAKGALLHKVETESIVEDYTFDERLLDRATFSKAVGGKSLTIFKQPFYLNVKTTLLEYIYEIGNSKISEWILIDNNSGRILDRYENMGDLIAYVQGNRAYGYIMDSDDVEIKIGVYDIVWGHGETK